MEEVVKEIWARFANLRKICNVCVGDLMDFARLGHERVQHAFSAPFLTNP